MRGKPIGPSEDQKGTLASVGEEWQKYQAVPRGDITSMLAGKLNAVGVRRNSNGAAVSATFQQKRLNLIQGKNLEIGDTVRVETRGMRKGPQGEISQITPAGRISIKGYSEEFSPKSIVLVQKRGSQS